MLLPATVEKKALEPSAIEKMPRGYFLGIDHAAPGSQDKMVQVFPPAVDPEYVSPLMRRLGYTRNPLTCGHYRKRLYLGTTQWLCAECGERL